MRPGGNPDIGKHASKGGEALIAKRGSEWMKKIRKMGTRKRRAQKKGTISVK